VKTESPPSIPAGSEGPLESVASLASGAPSGVAHRSDVPAPLATLDLALLRGALEEIPFGVATTRAGSILYANEALARIYGVPAGSLEHRPVADLFPADAYARIAQRVEEARVFDGRISTRTFDGRGLDADVHVEWYSSAAQGVGGFLVVRDLTLELSALARLVDQLGGAMFRVCVADGTLEHVSPAVAQLTGLDAATCSQHPVLLTALVSAEERERVMFLYRRMAAGEIPVGSAQVSLTLPDGTRRVVQLRASGRCDTGGVVRHIEGVVSDAGRSVEPAEGTPEGRGAPDPRARGRGVFESGGASWPTTRFDAERLRPSGGDDPLAGATMELSHELLRESSQHLHTVSRELRGVRAALKTHAAGLPPAFVRELEAHLDAAVSVSGGAAALNRSVRRVLAGATTLGAPLAEVLENVRATLAPVLGIAERALVIEAGDAATAIVPERIEEVSAALVYLALRAFRFAGSGSLRVIARRTEPLPEHLRARPRLSRSPGDQAQVVIEILGTAPADIVDTSVEISSDMLRTIPRPDEADVAYQAAQTLIASIGGSIESDDATFSTARSVVRLRV